MFSDPISLVMTPFTPSHSARDGLSMGSYYITKSINYFMIVLGYSLSFLSIQ